MIENITPVTTGELRTAVAAFKSEGYRFVTMSAVDLNETEADILYHFDKDLNMRHLRLTFPKAEMVPSISGVFFAALLAENEIQGQFGWKFDGLVLDYGEGLYYDEETRKTPFLKYGITKAR